MTDSPARRVALAEARRLALDDMAFATHHCQPMTEATQEQPITTSTRPTPLSFHGQPIHWDKDLETPPPHPLTYGGRAISTTPIPLHIPFILGLSYGVWVMGALSLWVAPVLVGGCGMLAGLWMVVRWFHRRKGGVG